MKQRLAVLAACLCLTAVVSAQQDVFRLRLVRSAEPPVDPGDFSTTWNRETTGWITVGTPVPEGQIPAGNVVAIDGAAADTCILNTWPNDGSARHVLVSKNLASTGDITLTTVTDPGGSYSPTLPSVTVDFAITSGPGNGSTYTATLPTLGSTTTVCNTANMRRVYAVVTPETGGSTDHDNLQVVFEVTSYNGSGHKVGIGIQNIRNVSTMDKVTVDMTTTIAGSGCSAMTKSSWTIYSGQRWHRTCTTSLTEGSIASTAGFWEPWIDANVLPRITATGVSGQDYALDSGCSNWELGGGGAWSTSFSNCTDPAAYGFVGWNQGNSENTGRDELTPIPDYIARWITLGNEDYREVALRTANQSGGFTMQIDKNGDGQSILRLDEDGNAGVVDTYPFDYAGLGWVTGGDGCGADARGTHQGDCSVGGNSTVDSEHLPDSNFHVYLYTGEKFYLDQLRFQSSWIAFYTPASYTEYDPYRWAGYYRGGNGAQGYQNWSEMGRAFARPMRLICRTAWALPDTYEATDYAYFHDLCENQLEAIEYYMDYLDSRGWSSSPYLQIGMNPAINWQCGEPLGFWQYCRQGDITSTTAGNPTIFTVAADADATCSGASACNDHDIQTGDYVDISGMVTSGATALNGEHLQATRINATQFSIAINTTSSTSGEGEWYRVTAPYFAFWRVHITGWETSWICFTGLWSCTSNMWAFPDKLAQQVLSIQTYTNYSANPGIAHNFYQVPGVYRGDDLSFFSSFADHHTGNNRDSNSGALLHGGWVYEAFYPAGSHRGQLQWDANNADEYYPSYAVPILVHGIRRGISGSSAGMTTILGANTVTGMLEYRPGFYWEAP